MEANDETIYVDSDQPTTCPKCGARTEWEDKGDHRLNTCLNKECNFIFKSVDAEDENEPKVFKLKEAIGNIPAGTLLYKGDLDDEENAIEWFDMTYEITDKYHTGRSFFNIDESSIEKASSLEENLVNQFLSGSIAERDQIRKILKHDEG